MAFSGCWQINTNAWNGLLTEDCPPKKIPYAFSGITMVQLAATFLTPISIILVQKFSIIPALRGRLLLCFSVPGVQMHTAFLESERNGPGQKRIAETKNIPLYRMLSGYGRVFKLIFTTPATRLLLILVITIGINNIIINTFFYDFATERLGLPTASLGYIPMIRAAVCLLFMFTAQSKINEKSHRAVLTVGLVLYAAALPARCCFRGLLDRSCALYFFSRQSPMRLSFRERNPCCFCMWIKKSVHGFMPCCMSSLWQFFTIWDSDGGHERCQPPVSLFICHHRFAGLRRADVLVPGRGDNRRLFCNGSIEKRIRPFFPCQHR